MSGARTPRRRAPAIVTLVVVAATAACSGGSGPDEDAAPSAAPSPEPTALADADAAALPVVRTAFCDSIDPAAVEGALDAPVSGTAHYANGDRTRLVGDVEDVAHEFGCTYDAEAGTRARTWLFVPPVDDTEARELVSAAETADGCGPLEDAAAYGEPSVAVLCRSGPEGERTVEASYRGLFGDAWLSCSLSVPRAADVAREDLLARTDAWCLEAARAAAT